MIINLSLTLPDEVSAAEVAAYLREMANSAAEQIEQSLISVPEIDEIIYIDAYSDDREAQLFRSE